MMLAQKQVSMGTIVGIVETVCSKPQFPNVCLFFSSADKLFHLDVENCDSYCTLTVAGCHLEENAMFTRAQSRSNWLGALFVL